MPSWGQEAGPDVLTARFGTTAKTVPYSLTHRLQKLYVGSGGAAQAVAGERGLLS